MSNKPNRPPSTDLPAGLAQPAVRALIGAGYSRLEQLAGVREADIAQLHGVGPNAVKLLNQELAARGLSFAGRTDQPAEHDFPAHIGRPATAALLHAGYTRLNELTGVSEKELLKIHGVGPKAVRLLREELESRGLSFAQPATRK